MNASFTFWLFNILLLPLYPLLAVYTLWRRFVQKKSAASFAGQWGQVPRGVVAALRPPAGSTPDRSTPEEHSPVIWLHAVSVGEQMAARPIARALKTEMPDCVIALSATTDTGFQTAQAALKASEADAVFYFPMDLPLSVLRALKAIRPDVFLAVETELWPNFLHLARRRGVLCLLVNGRVSDNLLQRAGKTKWLWRWMFSNLNALLMRSEFDAQRMQKIARETQSPGAENKIVALGDVKLDGASALENSRALREKWRAELGFAEHAPVVIFGSTHPGEEEIALRVYKNLRAEFPELKLLLAPRHIERTDEVQSLIEAQNFSFARRSEIGGENNSIILLDTVGELSEIYAAGDVAFVGGSLIPRGGHNVLEPILRGVPVFFGPHMANFRAHAELVQANALGDGVQDESDLQEKMADWLRDENRRRVLPERATRALAPHQGAPARIAQTIAKELKSKAGKQSSPSKVQRKL
jgi:3-deoxy-D-manno-octulosonic-acid transferase